MSIDSDRLELQQTVNIVVSVAGGNPSVGGVALSAPTGGQFAVVAGSGMSANADWVIHTQPQVAVGGQLEFRVTWQAPSTPGLGDLQVAVLSANGDGRSTGDRSARQSIALAWGCEPLTSYWDGDGDGFGRDDSPLVSCEPQEGYALASGDCDDKDALIHPGAPELCNQKDDDCDQAVDEEVMGQGFMDQDGDGFGDPAAPADGCPAAAVTNDADCNDQDAAINPDAAELCDGQDNNCDGFIDEQACATDSLPTATTVESTPVPTTSSQDLPAATTAPSQLPPNGSGVPTTDAPPAEGDTGPETSGVGQTAGNAPTTNTASLSPGGSETTFSDGASDPTMTSASAVEAEALPASGSTRDGAGCALVRPSVNCRQGFGWALTLLLAVLGGRRFRIRGRWKGKVADKG